VITGGPEFWNTPLSNMAVSVGIFGAHCGLLDWFAVQCGPRSDFAAYLPSGCPICKAAMLYGRGGISGSTGRLSIIVMLLTGGAAARDQESAENEQHHGAAEKICGDAWCSVDSCGAFYQAGETGIPATRRRLAGDSDRVNRCFLRYIRI